MPKKRKAKAEKAKRSELATQSMEDAFGLAAERIGACAKELRENPDDAEALHQYRISLRVARSLVKFAKPYMAKKRCKELSERLKELQTPTSRLRELDMLVKHVGRAEGVSAKQPMGYRSATNAALAAEGSDVLRACRAAQAAERAAFMEGFGKKKTRKALARVQELLEDAKWGAAARKRGCRVKPLRKRVCAEQESCEIALREVDARDQAAVHDIRKRAKALRYVTRELAACLPPDSAQTSQDMKAVQDKLGDMLDARNNARLLRQICGERAEQRAAEFDRIADDIAAELVHAAQD